MKNLIRSLRKSNALILDTETTGLDGRAEILQIGIVNLEGDELLNTFVRPAKARRWPEAQRIHGLSWTDVKDAPTISELAPQLQDLLQDNLVAIYNADYDTRILRQSVKAANAQQQFHWLETANWPCVMKAYAQFYGQRNTRYGGFRWQKLENACRQQRVRVNNAHDALADAQMTAALIRAIEQKL